MNFLNALEWNEFISKSLRQISDAIKVEDLRDSVVESGLVFINNYLEDIEKVQVKDEEICKFNEGILRGHPGKALKNLAKFRNQKNLAISDEDRGYNDLTSYYDVLFNLLTRTTNKELLIQLIEEKFACYLIDELGSDYFIQTLRHKLYNAIILKCERILYKMVQVEESRTELSNQLHESNFATKLKPYLSSPEKYIFKIFN